MALSGQVHANLSPAGSWLKHHAFEIFLAALFALPFAYLIGWWLERPDPFVVWVVADQGTNEETMEMFREKAKVTFAKIGDVDVIVQLRNLPENTDDAAQRMAEDLSNRPDTLMVIGSGRSGLVEKALPVYFTANPRIPVLATTASDDQLLINCREDCYEWNRLPSVWHKEKFVPLLQLSPTNKVQASSAVDYAIDNGKHRFLIISSNESQNKPYIDNLVSEYEEAIQDAAAKGASEVNKFEVSAIPDDAKLREMEPKPDCLLYAGSFGEAQTVFSRFSHLHLADNPMMIFSDAVIQTRGTDVQLSQGFKLDPTAAMVPVRFTHQTVAADYNNHISTYDRDAFAIARTLIDDLNDRGVDLRMRARSLFHLHRVRDARRNLDRILRENSEVRTWYLGEETRVGERPNIYIFKGPNQYNGIFHVWKLQGPEKSPSAQMDDVDHWHPTHGIAAAQEAASRALR